MTADEILSTHSITLKTTRGRDGVPHQCFSIQFTFPKGKKRQMTGDSEEAVRKKVFAFFEASPITFEDLAYRWAMSESSGRGERYKRTYCLAPYRRFGPFFKERFAGEIKTEEFQRAGKSLIDKGNQPKSVNILFRMLKKIYRYGIGQGLVSNDPAKGITMLHDTVSFERRYLDDDAIRRLLMACEENDENALPLFFLCGISLDKFSLLRWCDVDFENKRINITRKFVHNTSEEIMELERMDRESKIVPDIAFDYLEKELEAVAKETGIGKSLARKSKEPIVKRLFHAGSKINAVEVYGAFSRFIQSALNESYTPTDVFFTSAVMSFKAGCDFSAVASICGARKALDMFNNPQKYGVTESRQTEDIGQHFEVLYNKRYLE